MGVVLITGATSGIGFELAQFYVRQGARLLLTAGLLREEALAPEGTIVCLASLSHYTGYPGAAVYAATKDGLTAYARCPAVAATVPQRLLTVFPGPTRAATAQTTAGRPAGCRPRRSLRRSIRPCKSVVAFSFRASAIS